MDILTGQQLLKKTGEVVNANEALKDKKIICYYFSAHWCPPCRNFTPILADFYNAPGTREVVLNDWAVYAYKKKSYLQELTKDSEEPLEVIFVSGDNSPEELMAYMNDLHGDWLAVQHGAVLSEQLLQKYEISGIPSLVVVNQSGQLISSNGRSEVTEKGPKAFQLWLQCSDSQGK